MSAPVSSNLPKRRPKAWLIALLAAMVLGLWFRRDAQNAVLTWLALNQDAPAQSVFDELVSHSDNPTGMIKRFWRTGKIPHRQMVVSYLKQAALSNPPWFGQVESFLTEATGDADLSVRELAFGTLASSRFADVPRLACGQLHDADPQARVLGLDYLRKRGDSSYLPEMFALLDDLDLRVVATADSVLRKWTGNDFGIRMSLSVPKQHEGRRAEVDSADAATIRAGVAEWKEWWKPRRKDYLDTKRHDPSLFPAARLVRQPDFTLRDLTGQSVRLSQFRGKRVLLNFWTTWCPACLAEIPDLVELQQRHPKDVVILGISLDGQPDAHGHEHGEGEGSGHAPDEGSEADLAQLRTKVKRMVKSRGINYRVLLDPTGKVGRRFNGHELPTNVLIDSQGNLRRRFLGGRPVAAFEAMLGELTDRPQNRTLP